MLRSFASKNVPSEDSDQMSSVNAQADLNLRWEHMSEDMFPDIAVQFLLLLKQTIKQTQFKLYGSK